MSGGVLYDIGRIYHGIHRKGQEYAAYFAKREADFKGAAAAKTQEEEAAAAAAARERAEEEAAAQEERHIIIDNGSRWCRVGVVGEDAPRRLLPACVATVDGELVAGEEAWGKDAARWPVPGEDLLLRDVAQTWEDREALWRRAFLSLDVQPHAVLMTEPPMCPKATRERLTAAMFDTFGVELFFLISAPLASLYASGRTTGIVVSCGYEACHSVPIYEGYAMPHATMTIPLGGKHVRELLASWQPGYHNESQLDRIVAKRTYVAPNFEEEMRNYVRPPPDAQGFESVFTTELFRCQELWFGAQEKFQGPEKVHTAPAACWHSIQKCDVDVRGDLVGNVLLAGGPTLATGFPERFRAELAKLAPSSGMMVKVIAPPEREMSAWIGCSVMASLSTFSRSWISRQEYEADGAAAVVQRKIA